MTAQPTDDEIRAYGGDPDFLRRLKNGEHLTEDFLKDLGDPERTYSPEWLEQARKAAKEAAESLFSGKSASISDLRASGERTSTGELNGLVPLTPFPLGAVQGVEEQAAPPILKMFAVFSPTALKAMKGNRGKLVAQAGHAFLHAWWDADIRHPVLAAAYRASPHAYKIGLNGTMTDDFEAPANADEAWFDRLVDLYRDKTGVTKVVDAGFTIFDGPTLTCVCIGPIAPDDREEILSGLRPLC